MDAADPGLEGQMALEGRTIAAQGLHADGHEGVAPSSRSARRSTAEGWRRPAGGSGPRRAWLGSIALHNFLKTQGTAT